MANASSTQVFMVVPAVRTMAKSFGTISTVLKGVAKALQVLSTTLKASAFVGMVGNLALAKLIDMYRPQIEEMAEKCAELDKDLKDAATAYENGDAEGARRFH